MSGRSRDLGAPPRLPLRIAFRVAGRSLRIRLFRSLVTVSSVVLAVAFLIVVTGEFLVARGIDRAVTLQRTPADRAADLGSDLERPREPRRLVALAPTWPALGLGPTPAAAGDAEALLTWIEAQTPAVRFTIVRTQEPLAWLLAQDAAGLERAAQPFAARWPLDGPRMQALGPQLPQLAQALAAAGTQERERVARVSAAGGPSAVLLRIEQGATADERQRIGVPTDAEADTALRQRLRLDRLRIVAAAALDRAQAGDPNAIATTDIADPGALAADLATPAGQALVRRAPRLAAWKPADGAQPAADALNALLNDAEFAAERRWRDSEDALAAGLGSEARALLRAGPRKLGPRKLSRLSRLLIEATLPSLARRDPSPVYALSDLADGTLAQDARGKRVHAAVAAALDPDGGPAALDALAADLRQRASLADGAQRLQAAGFDRSGGGKRTAWLLSLALLVCIVGIVNSMMMAVTERFREIATMKCLGATDRFILRAFLIESAAIGAAGAALGVVLGLVVTSAQAAWRFGPWLAAAPIGELALAAAAAGAAGVVLTVLGALPPALAAARMHPIEAMRVEA